MHGATIKIDRLYAYFDSKTKASHMMQCYIFVGISIRTQESAIYHSRCVKISRGN